MVAACVSMTDLSLFEHTSRQLTRLCDVIGFSEHDRRVAIELLSELLGPSGAYPLFWPPLSDSNVADDATPVEFSLAFDTSGEYAIRVLGERVGTSSPREFLDVLTVRYGLDPRRLDAVSDLFLPHDERQGPFTLWYSLIFRAGHAPGIKVYLNPQISGRTLADSLVHEGFRRLRMGKAFEPVIEHALRRGERDNFTFFALDLNRDPRSRVKVYIEHDAARPADAERAASLVPGLDPLSIRDFCAVLGGGNGTFAARPLISSYSFVEGDETRPSNYSLYLPIRSYVPDDEVALARVRAILAEYDFDGSKLDDAISAISERELRDGVGLIPHVSLRMGEVNPGITVYLSSEAYRVMPARKRPMLGIGH